MNLFVYGTLRKNLALHDLLKPCVQTELSAGECYVLGRLHFAPDAGYPVLRPHQPVKWSQEVIGDLYKCWQYDPEFTDILLMELAAGYSVEWLSVFDRNTHEKLEDALAFTWKSPNVGKLIPSGDYKDVEQAWA